ncbi:MAG: glycosyltransferase family 92 protein, partial [FCB group bacterium]|nr:glycosyltransferase family 92 protein [FCB group bacterium]
ANRDELISDLAELDYVKIIPWDFPYGIYRSHGNKFCQTGALNHCRLKFGKDAVLFNFDIDELLVYPSEKLYSFLEKGKIVKFGGISVPVVGELPEDYSYDYFTQRKKLGQMGLQKYVCRSNAIIVNHVHKARHKRGNLTTNLDRAKFSLHKFLKKLTGKSDLPANLAYREIDLEDGYYLHYQGINTGWKKGERTLNIQEDLELQKIT